MTQYKFVDQRKKLGGIEKTHFNMKVKLYHETCYCHFKVIHDERESDLLKNQISLLNCKKLY